MNISSAKKFNIHIVNKRRLGRAGFGERLSDLTDVDALKEEIADILAKNGRVYGIYENKELVGVYLFEKRENYFVKNESEIVLGSHKFNLDEFEEFWYGSSRASLYLKKCVCLEEAEACKEKLEKDIQADLTDYIQIFGQVAGVEWNDKLLYQKWVKKQPRQEWLRILGWFAVGFLMGEIIFDGIVMRICLGFVWSTLGLAGIEESTKMDTLDFVRKGGVTEDAIK